MANQTQDRNTPRRAGTQYSDRVATNTVIYAGAMYAFNASGFAVKGGTAGSSRVRAVAHVRADNTGGVDGAIRVEGERGVYRMANSAGGDEVTHTEIGLLCYADDDQTVAKTDDGGTRPVAGVVIDVDSVGVWVEVGAYNG